jgi:hypothetical protein
LQETNDFFNNGFGWVCRQCDHELSRNSSDGRSHSRLLAEGEAESKTPQLSTLALAKWADIERRTLMCPRCGTVERIDIA